MANLDKTYLTLDQASVKYSMSIDTLRRWAREGRIPAFRIGRKYLIDIEKMEDFIQARPNSSQGVTDEQG